MTDQNTADGTEPTTGRRLLTATAVMASGTLVSRVLGFVKVMMVAFVLGNGTTQADIFSMATLIPNTLFMLFAGGALNTVLVPQIVRAVINDEDGGQAYVNRIMTAFLLVLGVMTVVMMVLTPAILFLYTSSRWHSAALADHYQNLVMMTYLTMPQIFFYGAFFLIAQVLNAKDRFGPMQWAPIANNVISILVLGGYIVLWGTGGDRTAPFLDTQVWILGMGATLGIVIQTAVLIPFMRKAGFRYRPRFDLKGVGLGHTFHVAKWMVFYVALTTVAQIIVTNLASSATAGRVGAGVTTYNNAYLVWILPHSLITVSLATAMLPSASRQAAAGNMEGVERETTTTTRLATTFLVPMSLGFIVLAEPFSRLAFGHGRGAEDAGFVALTLVGFALGLVPYTLQYLHTRGYYALEDTRSVFLLQCIISGLNAGLAVAFVLPWNDPGSVAPRLALAYSISYFVGAWVTHVWLKRRLPTLSGQSTLAHLRRLFLATLPAALAAFLISWPFRALNSTLLQLAGLVLAAGVAVLLFFFTAKRMGIPEASQLLAILRRRGRGASSPEGEPQALADLPEEARAEAGATIADGDPQAELLATAATANAVLHYPDPAVEEVAGAITPDESDDISKAEVGQRLGDRYRLDELLMVRHRTMTWRAFDEVLSRATLVHVLAPDAPRTQEVLELARRAATATDSRFLRVLDAVEVTDAEHGSYIVYEYAPGYSLEKVLQTGPLTGLEAAWVTREVADALVSMHAKGLYHQQLNPDTVIITATGNVKIVGFLVESELHPNEDQRLTPEEQDVHALGKLLYACLVARWPGREAYGLRAAPKSRESGRVLIPSQVRAGVSRPVDQVCDRILSPVPRNKLSRLTTVQQVMTQLSLVLGSASAAQDLESRLRMPIDAFKTTPVPDPTWIPHHPQRMITPAGAEAEDSAPTAASPITGGASTQPYDAVESTPTAAFTPVPPPPPRTPLPTPHQQPPSAGRHRRILVILLGFFAVILVLSLIWVAVSQLRSPRVAPPPASVPATTAAAIKIVKATDFDPRDDGGSAAENPRLAKRAIDSDPTSAWRTERYRGNPQLGKLKPGVGLVLDLGKATAVRTVTIALLGTGTNLEVRVPGQSSDAPPLRSQSQWRTISGLTNASGTVVVTLPKAETTRYLLVYLTSLPPDGGRYYRGGIQNIEVRG